MSAPPKNERVALHDAVYALAEFLGDLAARQQIKSRASVGILGVWASSFEQITPKHYEKMREVAYCEALLAAKGDMVAAALATQYWQPGPSVEWELHQETDRPLEREFWKFVPIDDAVWETSNFLGRVRRLEGVELNWQGIFVHRQSIIAMGAALDAPDSAPASHEGAPSLALTVPGDDELERWAKKFHAANGGRVDWKRKGQPALIAEFPGVRFKAGEALRIATSLGLNRPYGR